MQQTCKCKDCGHDFQNYTSDEQVCPYCQSDNVESVDIAY